MAASQRTLDLDFVTLRNINVRNINNSYITSNFTLLSDGKGGTYWKSLIIDSNINVTLSNLTAVNSLISPLGVITTLSNTVVNTTTLNTTTLNATSLITSNITVNGTFNLENARFPTVNVTNIFLSNNWSNASNYTKLSNTNYYLSNDDMGSYIFISSPSNLAVLPPGVSNNLYTSQKQGNFFVLKNIGACNINIFTNNTTAFPVITSTSATFFYIGNPQNFWLPM